MRSAARGQLGITNEDGNVEEVGHGFLCDDPGWRRLGTKGLQHSFNHRRCGRAFSRLFCITKLRIPVLHPKAFLLRKAPATAFTSDPATA